jgi:hypothetical protein
MLTITHRHMSAFSAVLHDQFARRAITQLSASFASEAATRGRDGMLALVRRGVERASRYGIKAEDDVLGFLELMLRQGEDFEQRDSSAWMLRILTRGYLPGNEKMQRIRDGLRDLTTRAEGT